MKNIFKLISWPNSLIFVALLAFVGCSQKPPSNNLIRYCSPIDNEKEEIDKEFTPLQFKGSIKDIEKKEYPGKHFVYEARLELGTSPTDKYSGYTCEDFFVDGSTECFVGFHVRMREKISIGDTIVKRSGTYKFYLIGKDKDTLISELESPGWCIGQDCTYERDGKSLCSYH